MGLHTLEICRGKKPLIMKRFMLKKIVTIGSMKYYMCQKVTEMRSMIGHKKDNNLWVRGSERPTADTKQNLTKKPETPLPLSSRK